MGAENGQRWGVGWAGWVSGEGGLNGGSPAYCNLFIVAMTQTEIEVRRRTGQLPLYLNSLAEEWPPTV